MKLDITGFLAKQAQGKEVKSKASAPSNNGPGPGKKQCKKCLNYIGVRSQVCKICNHILVSNAVQQDFIITKNTVTEASKEFIIPENPEYVYEHLRLDTWEKEQAERIIAKKNTLSQTLDEKFYAPTWRETCKTIEQVLNRNGNPWDLTLKEDLNRIIIKCIPTNNYRPSHHPKLSNNREMIVVELVEV